MMHHLSMPDFKRVLFTPADGINDGAVNENVGAVS